ncbi:hypothetical protein H4P12_08360 [Paracoccus sp. 11-3]|uniref:Uncharacterized protein n=1 Tax=Paracoccus amoyensis TaxID=2760093 RepID=A0A926G920_9RHOB|nr:hypothetical protein [Paracoccus amoyensis]MBC9246723.1 hypothetical protein [Paracoccus amoyensis]
MTFYLMGDPEAALRLKSFSSSSRSDKQIIKIEIEVSDPIRFGYALSDLAEVQAAQRAKPKPLDKRLALPKPEVRS